VQLQGTGSANRATQATTVYARSIYLSVGLQTSILAYMVCSFFLSIEYNWYVYYPIALAASLKYLYAREFDFGKRPLCGLPGRGRS